jgi:tetratricopeptide (TPR) repeat protein
MPTRRQLQEFSSLFHKIGNEAEIAAAEGVPLPEMELPERDPASNPFDKPADEPSFEMDDELRDLISGDIVDTLPPLEEEQPAPEAGDDDFDFGDFLEPEGRDGADFPEMGGEETFGAEEPSEEAETDLPGDGEGSDFDDFNFDDLNLGEDAPSIDDAPFADEAPSDEGAPPDAPPDVPFADEAPSDEGAPSVEGGQEDIGTEEAPVFSPETPVSDEFSPDIPPELFQDTSGGEAEDFGFDDLNLGDLVDGEEAAWEGEDVPAGEEAPEEEEGFSLYEEGGPEQAEAAASGEAAAGSDEAAASDEAAGSGEAADGFDGFAMDDFGSPEAVLPDLGEPEKAAPAEALADFGDSFDNFSLDGTDADADFAMPGSDSGFDSSIFDDISGEGREESDSGRLIPTISGDEDEEEIEEIQLSDEDLQNLESTLESYPLNLRIACEEIIAEQAVLPQLMSSLINKLVAGAPPRETAALAEKILIRHIPIPRGFEKKTGAQLEAEKSSFVYIFVHKFIPIARMFLLWAMIGAGVFYLSYQLIYKPIWAEGIYKRGYERIAAGEYDRANRNFEEAFEIRRKKKWFFRYAEAYRDVRAYTYAEEKYDQLLRVYPRDKEGALAYADLETYYLHNYEKASQILRYNILNYKDNDKEGLLAFGDLNLLWGEIDSEKYDDARRSFARLIEQYGPKDEYMERMLKYFIRTDNLGQVIPLQQRFMGSKKSKIAGSTLAELGGYLLDKRLEEVRGVPDENLGRIEGIREVLLRAVDTDRSWPESHYHLSRFYRELGSVPEELHTLSEAIQRFENSPELSARRTSYRIKAYERDAELLLTSRREFFRAEKQLIEGIRVYEDALERRLLRPAPEYGKLYADLGDLEYFYKDGNTERAIENYLKGEQNGYAPPEILYRLGACYYQEGSLEEALGRLFEASRKMPFNRRMLYALGNAAYRRGDYRAAQGYYSQLLGVLEREQSRFPLLSPGERPEHMELAERIMVARNNLAVTYEAIAKNTGDPSLSVKAQGLYAESARAWDALTRDVKSMARMGSVGFNGPGINQALLNAQASLRPVPGYEPQIYTRLDKDVLEPSVWEKINPPLAGLSGDIPFQVRE